MKQLSAILQALGMSAESLPLMLVLALLPGIPRFIPRNRRWRAALESRRAVRSEQPWRPATKAAAAPAAPPRSAAAKSHMRPS